MIYLMKNITPLPAWDRAVEAHRLKLERDYVPTFLVGCQYSIENHTTM